MAILVNQHLTQAAAFSLTSSASYDSCDVGVMPNQTDANGPPAALVPLEPAPAGRGRPDFNYQLSMLPGQRLRCGNPIWIRASS